jgi:hypothetical protein
MTRSRSGYRCVATFGEHPLDLPISPFHTKSRYNGFHRQAPWQPPARPDLFEVLAGGESSGAGDYGDSVGHYEGDVLVVDTVGIRNLRP